MALRKLHSKVIKQYTETQRLQEQLAALEADREDAWRQAHEFAQELDDRTAAERMGPPEQGSRRSSRVLVARKNSTRATKAGLRSSMYRRSHRSSTSSAHNSVTSPAMRSAASGVVPPVPPIPMRNPLGIVTDLPTGSSMGMSSESPSSDIRAMIEAQREICEMLGISPEELKVPPRRRRSFSASLDAKGAISPNLVRRASEVLSITSRTPGSAQTLFGIGSPLSSL
ncbi:hypothetical protein B0H21DRAFT_302170 [Amylocystis lapponica]|nr:hypothetical protein B0H21DRAFT_302170 [Amylocystis lapponica]